jgi:folate-binding protein YgfZ
MSEVASLTDMHDSGASGRARSQRADETDAGYRAARESVAIIARNDLLQLRMWGRDPARMLNGLITNDIEKAAATRAVYGAMLTPKGRMLTDLRAFRVPTEGEAELLVDLPVAALEGVREHLKKYVPPLFARWGDSPSAVIGLHGPKSGDVVTEVWGDRPGGGEDSLLWVKYEGEAIAIVATGVVGSDGYDIFAPQARAGELWTALLPTVKRLGGGELDQSAFEVLRVEAGRPRYGIEMTDETLPAEVFETIGQMERAVSFSKGCYTGQEVVIRIAHRGHVNRHLRGLLLGKTPPPLRRTPVLHADTDKEVGWTTSSVESPLMGQTIALCMLRREVSPGDRVRVGSDHVVGTVGDLPFARS